MRDAIPENTLTEEAKNELNKIKEMKRRQIKKIQFIEQVIIHIVLKISELLVETFIAAKLL